MASKSPSVAVVGGGVIGVTSALSILEKDPSVKVTVIAEKFTPDNTTDGAAGVIMPFVLWDTPEQLCRKWFGKTVKQWKQLMDSSMGPELGIFLIHGSTVFDTKQKDPIWKDQVYGFHRMTTQELEDFPFLAKDGFSFSTLMAQGGYYMPWLMNRVRDLGGVFVQRRIKSLQELSSKYDVVVNCTGMGARKLVGDKLLRPIRGQVLRVNAPWMKKFVFYHNEEQEKKGRCAYILPQIKDEVVLGGTDQLDNYNTKPTLIDTVNILQDCYQLAPSLKNAGIIKNWAGLRPGRKTVRLEKEVMKFKDDSGIEGELKVVHNYGHGGSGPSLCFGCAEDCSDLVFQLLATNTKAKL